MRALTLTLGSLTLSLLACAITPAAAQMPISFSMSAECQDGSELEERPPHCVTHREAPFLPGTERIWPNTKVPRALASIDLGGTPLQDRALAARVEHEGYDLPAGLLMARMAFRQQGLFYRTMWCGSAVDRKRKPAVLCFQEAPAGQDTDWYRFKGMAKLSSVDLKMPSATRAPAPELTAPASAATPSVYALLFDRVETDALIAHVAAVGAAGETGVEPRRIEREPDGSAVFAFMGVRYKATFSAAGEVASVVATPQTANTETPVQRAKREQKAPNAMVEFVAEPPLSTTPFELQPGQVAASFLVRSAPAMRQAIAPENDARFGAARDALTPALVGGKTVYCHFTGAPGADSRAGYCLADYDGDGRAERLYDKVRYGLSRIVPDHIGLSRRLATPVGLTAAPDVPRIEEQLVYLLNGFERQLASGREERLAMFQVMVLPLELPDEPIRLTASYRFGFPFDKAGVALVRGPDHEAFGTITDRSGRMEFARTAPVKTGMRVVR